MSLGERHGLRAGRDHCGESPDARLVITVAGPSLLGKYPDRLTNVYLVD